MKAYSRTFSPAVAGLTQSMFFNVSSGDFRLVYVVTNNNSRIATEIFVSALWYPKGIWVAATASSGSMHIEQQWEKNAEDPTTKSGRVLVFPQTAVMEGSMVTVTVTSTV